MKNTVNKSIGKIGVSKVALVVNQANCIFHKIDLENDLGNDAFIEFISGNESTSFCIATQIKSGGSFVRNGIKIFIPADKEHLKYWKNLNLPVAGLVYNPSKDTIYWIDIKEYILNHPDIIENGPYNIPVPTENLFSLDTFNSFFEHFITYNEGMTDSQSFLNAINNISEIYDIEQQYIGVKNLFAYHRNKFATWFIFFNYFKYCNDQYLKRNLINIITLIPGHGDIFWFKGNIIDEDIQDKALNLLKKMWGKTEIKQLLEFINEDEGIQRGSIGQSIYAIIDRIEGYLDILKEIAFDENTDENSGYWALIMYLFDFQTSHSTEEIIELIDLYIKKFPANSKEVMPELRQVIIEEGGIYY